MAGRLLDRPTDGLGYADGHNSPRRLEVNLGRGGHEMLKRFLNCGSIVVAAVLLAAPARAATVIDFATGTASMGGWLTWDGTNVNGSNIPIGTVTIANAPTGNGTYEVYGTATGTGTHVPGGSNLFGDLDFSTGPASFISLAGCIPGLS